MSWDSLSLVELAPFFSLAASFNFLKSSCLAQSSWTAFSISLYLGSSAVTIRNRGSCSQSPGCVYFLKCFLSPLSNSCSASDTYGWHLNSSRWRLRSIMEGMIQETVVNSSPWTSVVNAARGWSRSWIASSNLHSLTVRLSYSYFSRTQVMEFRTSNIRLISSALGNLEQVSFRWEKY